MSSKALSEDKEMKVISKVVFKGVPSNSYPEGVCFCLEPVEGDSNHTHVHTSHGLQKVCIGDEVVKYSDGTFNVYKKIEEKHISGFLNTISESAPQQKTVEQLCIEHYGGWHQGMQFTKGELQQLCEMYASQFKSKVEFYRNETSKLRDYVESRKIGRPTQGIFDALYEYITELESKDNIPERDSQWISVNSLDERRKKLIRLIDAATLNPNVSDLEIQHLVGQRDMLWELINTAEKYPHPLNPPK